MGKSSAPPAPDYIGAAQEQGRQNIKAARTNAQLNNPDYITPYGTQTVTYGDSFDQAGYDKAMAQYQKDQAAYDAAWNRWNEGGAYDPNLLSQFPGSSLTNEYSNMLHDIPVFGGLFGGERGPREGPFDLKRPTAPNRTAFTTNPNHATVRQTLSPEQQRIYDQTVTIQQLLGGLGIQGANSLQGIVGVPVDYTGAPRMPGDLSEIRDNAYNAMMYRPTMDYNRAKDDLNSNLIAAGLHPGEKGYDNQMALLGRGLTDAQMQAGLFAGQQAQLQQGLAQQARNQWLQEYQNKRQTPINEISALLSGSQVSNPFSVGAYSGTANAQPSPIFGGISQLGQYNTDAFNLGQSQQGQMLGAGVGMAGALALAFF